MIMSSDENEEKVSALTGLLDFYSDRAEAQASFLVACVFGLFSLLAIAQSIENVLLMLVSIAPYVILASVGVHCLQRFTFYGNMAETIRETIEHVYAKPDEIPVWIEEKKKTTLKEFRDKMKEKYGGILRRFGTPRRRILGAILIFGLPFLVVYLPKLYELVMTAGKWWFIAIIVLVVSGVLGIATVSVYWYWYQKTSKK